MVTSSFPTALKFTLKEEGGNVDNPHDPGGRTSRGITQRTYDAYRRHQKLPVQDVYHATDTEVASIYHSTYWEPYADRWPVGVDLVYFDFAVNAGPHESLICLQRTVGVNGDGICGPITVETVQNYPAVNTVESFTAARKSFYESLHNRLFLHDWLGRSDRAQAAALAMIGESNVNQA